MFRRYSLLGVLALAMGFFLAAGELAGHERNGPTTAKAASAAAVANKQEEAAQRIQGEERFHANCGRCHQSPHRFPPRMMATIIRHMRVRATITDEDMRLILQYMAQ